MSFSTTISLLCPTRGRSSQAIRLALSILHTAVQPKNVELLFYVDANDSEKPRYVSEIKQHQAILNQLKRCLLIIGEPIGVSKAWNELAVQSQGDLLVMAADDQVYRDRGWDQRLVSEVQKFPDQIFCMWFNEGHWGEKLCTFPIVSRKWCLTLGYFTTGLFECLYDDLWIMDLAKRLDRLHYIPDILTEHLHWSYGKGEIDATYQWKQVSASGQIKPAVVRDMNLFGRTAPYRETDARRLMTVMTNLSPLKPGLANIGKPSIFTDTRSPTASVASEHQVTSDRQVTSDSQVTSPTLQIVTLCLKDDPARSFKLRLNIRALTQSLMLKDFSQGQFYKPEVAQFLMQVLQPGDGFLDIGAHIGYFSLLAAQLVGDRGSVVAVEMEPENYTNLLQNLQLNSCDQVRGLNLAIGAETKLTDFFVNLDNEGGHALWNVSRHSFNQKSRVRQPQQSTQMETIDRLLHQQPIPRLKMIKIAIEGAEHEVLKGSITNLQAQQIPYIVCEINPLSLQQMQADEFMLRDFMADQGYTAYLLNPISGKPIQLFADQPGASSTSHNLLFTRLQGIAQ